MKDVSSVLKPDVLNEVILLFILFMGVLVLLMGLLLIFYSNRQKLRERRKQLAQTVVQKAIFFDSSLNSSYGFYGYKFIQDRRFRDVLVADIITASKNLTGGALIQLKQLYQQLDLEEYALRKLNSPLWYLKAQGLQELATLQLVKYVPKLAKLVNHPNELVRMEAQNALLQLQGFQGLEFLAHVSYPISDWQQIKLLHDLHELPATADIEIKKWLKSANDTVCILAIRIVKQFHLFQLHDLIVSCLDHPGPKVRHEAIIALKDIYTAETSKELEKRYPGEIQQNRLNIVNVLKFIGSPDDINFLKTNLPFVNNELKVALIRAIAAIDPSRLADFELHEANSNYPEAQIIRQVKEELKQ